MFRYIAGLVIAATALAAITASAATMAVDGGVLQTWTLPVAIEGPNARPPPPV